MPYEDNYKENRYYSDDRTPFEEVGGGFLTALGISIAGVIGYKSGAAKPLMESLIKNIGEYKGTKILTSSQALKTWAKSNAGVNKSALRNNALENIKTILNKDTRKELIDQTRKDIDNFKTFLKTAKEKANRATAEGIAKSSVKDDLHWLYSDPSLVENYKAINYIKNNLISKQWQHKEIQPVVNKMHEELIKSFTVTADDQMKMLERTGFRYMTMGDLLNRNMDEILDESTIKAIGPELRSFIEDGAPNAEKWRHLYLDKNLLINTTGQVADTRAFVNSLRKASETMSEQFHIPFININPMKLFYTGRFIEKPKPIFAVLQEGTVQPGVTGGTEKIGEELFYIAGNIFKGNDFNKAIAEGMTLENINAATNVTARYLRSMAGISLKEFKDVSKQDGIRYYWSQLAKKIDVGFQDISAPDIDLGNPMTYTAIIDKLLKGVARPHGGIDSATLLSEAFGKSYGFIAMKESKKLRDVINPNVGTTLTDYVGQFFKGRNSLEEVTPLTLVPYAFMERLNQGLGAAGLGLSRQHTGSAWDVYKNLLTKRIFPVMAGVSLYNYTNYEAENLTGTSPEEVFADAYVNANLNFASLRDMLGLTEKAKRMETLMPGFDQITGIPGGGILDWTDTAEELEDYYKTGEDPIRKGRWWPIGNTPLSGMKVEYYRPNWYRRLKSDWEYSDSLYGSKDEYWAHHWMPTPRYPLAPISHFITDNRWLEEKHYQDRPYPVSEGIAEIKGIPIFGPVLNETIGEILKPQMKMHEEYWQGDKLLTDEERGVAPQPSYNPADQEYEYGKIIEAGTEDSVRTGFAYTTSSGKPQPMYAPGRAHITEMNKALKAKSLGKTIGTAKSMYMRSETPEVIKEQPPINEIGAETMIDITELGGIYGFSFASVLPTDPEWRDEIATSTDINNWSDTFWEASLGGVGGDISEIYRRFIPRDKNKLKEINPIRNTMPNWIPGSDYFMDLQHGDPYKMPYGEIRMPGEAYERINRMRNPMEMGIGSSMLGKSKEEMVKHFFHEDDAMSDFLQDIVSKGTKMHEKIEKSFADRGFLIDSEKTIKSKEHGWIGTYDARVADSTSPASQSIMDIKTVSQKKYEALQAGREAYEENVGQVNVYLHETGLPKGYVYYLNRDDKDTEPIVREVYYNASMYEQQMKNLEDARNEVRRLIASGERSRADLYDHVDRFKILADVAPWSNQYKMQKQMLSRMQLTEKDKEEIRETKAQVKEQKKKKRTYDYKYATANLQYEKVKITKVIDSNTFITAEHPNNPIKLAGVRVSVAKNNEEAEKAAEYISKYINKGDTVVIGYDMDEAKRVAKDTYKSIRAVVKSGWMDGVNVNRELIKRGLGKEKETDFSPASINARFSDLEIGLASTWERFAHLDTFVHTKVMQVRSPLESYKRREVYGKDFQDWKNPIEDYLIPTIESFGDRNALVSLGYGAIIGRLFGSKLYGKTIGTLVGASIAFGMSAFADIREELDREKWIPERREKERNLEEYVDILKYIKSRRLYEKYKDLALDKEGFDVEKYMRRKSKEGEGRSKRKEWLMNVKRRLYMGKISWEKAMEEADLYDTEGIETEEDFTRALNQEVNKISEFREVENIPSFALKALAYHNQSERTMYGYDPGDPIVNAFSALPSKDRQYFQEFIDAPEEEKQEILDVAPDYMKRMLQSVWGMPAQDKPNLLEYFQTRNLPGKEWKGWRESSNMDMIKIKLVNHEALDASEFNIWPEQEAQARMEEAQAPIMDMYDSETSIRNKLSDVLHGMGIEDLNVRVYKTKQSGININANFEEDRKYRIEQYIRENEDRLFS
jgi:4-hydroxy-3-methylbut-2-enyl diphosphate reductase IspH